MKPLITFILILLAQLVEAANYTNTTSGNFSAGATWIGGVAPSLGGDTWQIQTNTTVFYDVNNQNTSGWGASSNNGWLVMTNLPCYLLMGGNLSGYGTNLIGSSNNPVPFTSTNTPMCYIQFTNSATTTMIGTNNIQWYGTTYVNSNALTVATTANASSITVGTVPSWVSTNTAYWLQPTNTTQGQGGEFYMVGGVSGSVISNMQTLGGNTNFWPNTAFKSLVPAPTRPIGTTVYFYEGSVVVLDMVQRSTSVITGTCRSNIVSGIMQQNTGYGLAGGNSYWTAQSNVLNNCRYGFANSLCYGWTANNNTVINCANGGLAYNSCYGWTANNNTIINCVNGGLAYNVCNGWTANNNTVINCANGGLANSSCYGWYANNDTVINCSGGGLGYLAIDWIVNNTTNTGSGALFTTSYNIQCFNSPSTNDTLQPVAQGLPSSPYLTLIQYDCTKWYSINGSVTNMTGTNILAVTPTTANQPVPYHVTFSVLPYATKNVSVWTETTNAVVYSGGITLGSYGVPSSLATINAGGSSGVWSNTVLSWANTNSFPQVVSLWVSANCPTVTSNGYSMFTIGRDATVNSY